MLGIIATSCLAYYFSYQDTTNSKREKIRSVVEASISQILALQKLDIPDLEYQQRLKNLIYNTRYSDNDYLYLIDKAPRVILHPIKPELEGQLVTDIEGIEKPELIIQGFRDAFQAGSMFWSIMWPKPSGGPAKEKLTYAQVIPGTEMMLSTGIYVDDLNPLYFQRALSYTIITITVIIAAIIGAIVISRNIVRPIINLSSQMAGLSKGEIEQEFLFAQRQDEIGKMARSLERFRNHLIENNRLRHMQEHVKFLESFDPVTRLYNRQAMGEAIEREIIRNHENQDPVYFLFIRFDLLRNLTIELGEEQRDQILIEIANRLRSIMSVNHRLGRLSEGCFGLLLLNSPVDKNIETLATQILATIEQPIQLDTVQVQVGARIGITSFPDDGDQQFELMGRAEIAAKTARKMEQGWLHYSSIREQQSEQKMVIWQDISAAMDQDQFYLVFQPLFDLESNAPLSSEVLLRWEHPDRGFISPAVFVPLAEQSGLISRLDNWVLNAVAKQCRSWLDQNLTFPKVAINLSGISFLRPDFEDKLQEIFSSHNVDLNHIELELTEGVLIEDLSRIQEKLTRVRNTGVSISIDDFGTGYSSLSRIKNLPVDHIKIDKSFIDDLASSPQDLKIVQAIILMAQGLQLKVVAEGVETEQQLSILRKEHCDIVQGYLLSRPLSVADYETLIDEDLVIEGE
ncbi:EAL domain-containing protein [Neptuniibacter sp.]|uniref:EAL domain-containing protein n=1 Tax=Neptuniibacter sp. TaxID=1962643 RepID=UPI0026169E42|nr:EAL domain-containing protein [Neptuniibacter sp.]MCP4597179.1 EAL domain-containing protein [Neptuniibacter sp.]